jgi:hypothetical protein
MGQGWELVTDLTVCGVARLHENGFGKAGEVELVQPRTAHHLAKLGWIVKGTRYNGVQHWALSAEMLCRFGSPKKEAK